MTAPYAEIKATFLALLALDGPARADALAGLGDTRAEVEALLALHERPFLQLAAPMAAMAPTDRPPPALAGVVLSDQFEVQAQVAEGGFGWVFRGFDQRTLEPVAIKLFKAEGRWDAAQASELTGDHAGPPASDEALFFREGRVLAELSHLSPHIVAYRDVGHWSAPGGRHHAFIVMEWLEGLSLRHHPHPPLPWPEAVRLLTPIAEALALAHTHGIAHRDVKPENIMCVGTPPVLKLVDFGAAKRAAERTRGFASTAGRPSMVTIRYAAPEQLEALGPTGPWTDVHALALLLVELALGRHPFEHLSVSAIMDRLLDPIRPTPRQAGLTVSDTVEAVMKRALAVDPQQRPADAGAFWRALTS